MKKDNNKFKELLRVVKFTIISISAGIIQIALFALFNEVFSWDYWPAYLLSLLISILWNFTINRKVTFKATSNVKKAMLLVLLLYAVFTPASTILGQLCEDNGANEYIVLAVTMISNFILEFLYTRYFVYRNSCDTITVDKTTIKKPALYKFIAWTVKQFYKKVEVIGCENLDHEECLIVGNHAQMYGPLYGELHHPHSKDVWCIGEMMSIKEVSNYAYQDFWSNKPKGIRWFFKLASYIIAPLASYIFTHADTIPVYKDVRVASTFKKTIRSLLEHNHIIIFPENREKYNDIINDFQDKFIDVARMYYNKTKKSLAFVPMYNSGKLKKVVFGKPIYYNPDLEIGEQRKLICDYLKEEITNLALMLPRHKVIPYDNVGKKNYKYSK